MFLGIGILSISIAVIEFQKMKGYKVDQLNILLACVFAFNGMGQTIMYLIFKLKPLIVLDGINLVFYHGLLRRQEYKINNIFSVYLKGNELHLQLKDSSKIVQSIKLIPELDKGKLLSEINVKIQDNKPT